MARTKATIDWNRIEHMAIAGSNGVQIAAAIGIDYDTLVNRFHDEISHNSDFSDYLQQKRQKGNDMLLRKQFEVALEGDRTMLIWLGKQRLDQSEKIEQKTTNTYEGGQFSIEKIEIIHTEKNKEV